MMLDHSAPAAAGTPDDPELFAFETRRVGEAFVIHLYGELDLSTVDVLERPLDAVVSVPDGSAAVVLDLSALKFMDSAGLTALVAVLPRLREQGRRLVLRHPSRSTSRLLDISGFGALAGVTVLP
jgi:anti-sigma B factor antagonist